jgi:(2R)-3-sulfolactate dehydrogenase (NADP+)
MSTTLVRPADLQEMIARALVASNTSQANARSVALALTQAEIDGQKGHGISRLPSYAGQAKVGKVDGHVVPEVRQTRPGCLVIDAKNGFAFPALDIAIGQLPSVARAAGIAAAALTRSHHFGVAGHVAERLAQQGLVAVVMGNTPPAMAYWGGKRPIFGTNPIAFAAPQHGAPAIVVDMALSQVARGKIITAAQKGEAIPAHWALDERGRPTTDAKVALAGTLVPIGGAKGAALALMVELMAAALTGANFAFEASSFLDDKGAPPGVGQLLIAIDPAAFAGNEAFLARCAVLASAIEGDPGARLPGSRRLALREQAAREGVRVESKLLEEVRRLAQV